MSKIDTAEFNGSSHGSRAMLGTVSSNGTYINGSILPQRSFISLRIDDPDGKMVCDVVMTHEQLARLLTGNTYVDVTLQNYRTSDGSLVSEYVPEPLRVDERVKGRLGSRFDLALERLQVIENTINGSKALSAKAKDDLTRQIRVVEGNLKADISFTVTQALEEVTDVTESLLTGFSEAAKDLGIAPEAVASRLMPPTHEGKKPFLIRLWDWSVHDARITTVEDVKRNNSTWTSRVYAADQAELDQIVKSLTNGKPINKQGGYVVEVIEDNGHLLDNKEPAQLPEGGMEQ